MTEQSISLETAKLAKEKGFYFPVPQYYNSEERLTVNFEDSGSNEKTYYFQANYFNENWNDGRVVDASNNSCYGCKGSSYKEVYSAPTQSLLQKWLREVHNIFVGVELIETKYGAAVCRTTDGSLLLDGFTTTKTYEEALEEGLLEALKLIDQK